MGEYHEDLILPFWPVRENCFSFLNSASSVYTYHPILTATSLKFQLEERVNDVEKFYLNTIMKLPNSSKSTSTGKDKDMDKHIPSVKRLQQEASRREAAAAKRMHELMRQFGTIFRQVVVNK